MLEIATKTIAPGVDMPVISIECDNGGPKDEVKETVKNWLEQGGKGIDTGLSVHNILSGVVKDAITESGVDRKDIFLTMKIPFCIPDKVIERLDMDLNDLGTDYVDLLLLDHSHENGKGNCTLAWTEIENIYLNTNKARAIGVQNFNMKQLEQIFLDNQVTPHLIQLGLNLFTRHHFEEGEFLEDKNITLQSYSPFGHNNELRLAMVSKIPQIQNLAQKHNTNGYQIVIKWILQHGWLLTVPASIGPSILADVDLAGLQLTDTEMKTLDTLSNTSQKHSGLFGPDGLFGHHILNDHRNNSGLDGYNDELDEHHNNNVLSGHHSGWGDLSNWHGLPGHNGAGGQQNNGSSAGNNNGLDGHHNNNALSGHHSLGDLLHGFPGHNGAGGQHTGGGAGGQQNNGSSAGKLKDIDELIEHNKHNSLEFYNAMGHYKGLNKTLTATSSSRKSCGNNPVCIGSVLGSLVLLSLLVVTALVIKRSVVRKRRSAENNQDGLYRDQEDNNDEEPTASVDYEDENEEVVEPSPNKEIV